MRVVELSEQDREISLGGSDRRIFMREAIVKLFKNALRWSWQDKALIYLIDKAMLSFFLGIKSIPPTIDSFSIDSICQSFLH